MKRNSVFAAMSSLALLLTGCAGTGTATESKPDLPAVTTEAPAETVVTTEPAPEEKSLVTLGDSIAFGYGMDDPDEQRYSAIVSKALTERDGISWHDYNYALSSDDSADLLWRLQKGRAMHLPSADTVIINIGSNNLLGVYTDYVKEQVDYEDIDIESITDEQIEEMQTKIEDAFSDEETVRKELESRIDESLTQMESDLEEIYTWIRERNETADIYVLNIYNPYRGIESAGMPGTTEDFGTYAQTQIDRANAILTAFTDKHSDLIPVDIAEAFANCDPIPIVGAMTAELPTDSAAENSAETSESASLREMDYIDPHPNEDGQQLIAKTILAKMGL